MGEGFRENSSGIRRFAPHGGPGDAPAGIPIDPVVTTMPSEPEQRSLIEAARQKAFILYEGKQVPHRSCGICLAETFNLPTAPYQSLRRGGITGEGECGAIKAGELVIGEYFGDPNPTGAVTPKLREALHYYRDQWQKRANLGPGC